MGLFQAYVMATSMKVMKAIKRKSVIAKGRFAKAVVFKGSKEKTSSGLTKSMLFKNKRGKIVSKKKSAAGKKAFALIKSWTTAVTQAKKSLNITGFVAINGKSAIGKALYAKAKSMYTV